MNPSPDRSKECLPPKKRDSRQGSSDQPAPEDDFKPPAPFRSRRQHHSTESHRESRDLLPPPPPTLPPLPLPLPWQVSYTPSMHPSFLPVQVGERRGSASASWRETLCGRGMDGGLEHTIAHHSRWLSSDIPPISVQPLISMPMFKSVYTAESREMWSYGPSRRDYSSSLFSPHLFPQPTVYPHDTLPDSRLRYQGRRPNGVEGTDSGSGPSRRMASCDGRGNENVARLDGPHANGRRRQENTTRQTTGRGLLPRESTSAHSSPWDRDPLGTPKTPIPPSPDAKIGRAVTSQDHFGGSSSQAGAQIYYAVGSLCQSAHRNSPKYPQLSPSVSYSQRKSQHFLQSQHNSHEVETEWDPSVGSYHPPVAVLTGPNPPPSAVLPHFAKGSLIELAGGHLKRVEELKTEDFVQSADTLPEFHLSTCTILLISPGPTYGFNHLQVLLTDRNTQELLTVLAEYPFFVQDRGWSSCSPQRSAQLYGLQCRQLSTGDVCLALTPTPASPHSDSQVQRPHIHSEDMVERMPHAPAPSSPPAGQSSPSSLRSERPRARKRRWSAPELQPGIKTSTHLPQGSKHERQQ
ncbi:ataxin-1 [Carassius gibelio]|uniref:ataxin-1 n=1 Tax=Carassius gibelio TaxID=101364 RepID=UPI0022785490|nr:ataxin-1 [Carassius gibelio]XP_052449468.1 ataxin-1 [Carassius gibelio]XP_052449469.1 ataxin-1 [Carassius gibelio]XP_052449470.1 ataxin-1 [Carassius gibelio]XP_052449471.1 ataxin-1 [Carassius gibelio]XP_052449472.1 ataxin-1 [Carassius gibelio]